MSAIVVKNPLANAGDIRDPGALPGWERSPGGGNENPLHSCLEIPWAEEPEGYRPWNCRAGHD